MPSDHQSHSMPYTPLPSSMAWGGGRGEREREREREGRERGREGRERGREGSERGRGEREGGREGRGREGGRGEGGREGGRVYTIPSEITGMPKDHLICVNTITCTPTGHSKPQGNTCTSTMSCNYKLHDMLVYLYTIVHVYIHVQHTNYRSGLEYMYMYMYMYMYLTPGVVTLTMQN